MNYQRIDSTFDQAKTLLPEETAEWLELNRKNIKDFHLYGTLDGNDLVAFAAYVVYEEYSSICALAHIEVKEEYRGDYIGETLIKESARELKKKGYKIVKASVTEHDHALKGILVKNDFKKIFRSETLTYTLDDLKDSPTMNNMETLEKGFSYIKCYLDYDKDDAKLYEFEKWLNEYRPGVQLSKLNRRYTCFFEHEGKIRGYVAVQKIKSNFVIMKDILVMPSKNSRLALPVMMAYFAKNIFTDLPDDTTVALTFYDRGFVPVMESMFGEPDDRLIFDDYSIEC